MIGLDSLATLEGDILPLLAPLDAGSGALDADTHRSCPRLLDRLPSALRCA